MSVDVVLWYMSWGGVALSACIEQFVPPHRAEHTREIFSVLSAAAAMFQLPVPWAAVVGLIVYAVLSSKGFEFAANPLPLLAVALFALSAVRLVSLPLVSELPVYLGAIVLVGSTPGGLALTLCQAWVPLSIALALVPRSRLFWLLCMVLASLLLFGVGGSRVPRKRVAVVAGVKVCVFAIVVGVFRPYLAQPASSGSPGRFGLPCTVKLGDKVATDAENRPCVVDGNPCPLSFNGTYDLVCGGARRGVCVPLDDAQNVCHCLPGSCGTESEVRFLPLKNRYFAFGCSDTAVACVNGSAPLDEPSDTDALRWMQPSNRCRCICDRDDVVGAACNLTCPKSAGGVICNGFPCTSNANETQAVCLCDASVSGSACQSYNCNGNGRIVDGQCVCNDNYYPPGANGSSAVCNSTCDGAQCSGHGLCVSADACVCDAGWTASSKLQHVRPGADDGVRADRRVRQQHVHVPAEARPAFAVRDVRRPSTGPGHELHDVPDGVLPDDQRPLRAVQPGVRVRRLLILDAVPVPAGVRRSRRARATRRRATTRAARARATLASAVAAAIGRRPTCAASRARRQLRARRALAWRAATR